MGHSVRSCLLGMRLAREIGLSTDEQQDLYYSLLLKDAGCSSNASMLFHSIGSDDLQAKHDAKTTDWTRQSWEMVQYALKHVAPKRPFWERVKALVNTAIHQKEQGRRVSQIRCERGASLARLMGLSEKTAEAIRSLDEHWDGNGNSEGLKGREIPIFSRVMLFSQTLEVFLETADGETALRVAGERGGRWFDPDLVKAAKSLDRRGALWADVRSENVSELVLRREPNRKRLEEGNTTFDSICMAFAQIVDAKSPFTYDHSNGVANAAVAMARTVGLSKERVLFLRHAALLHDIGKLSVSNEILEKQGKPDAAEWEILRLHPFHSWNILRQIPGFRELSEVAGSHHEKLDGSGYFRGLDAPHLPFEARALAVADVFDALAAKRPYRDAIPVDEVFRIMRNSAPHALDASCIEALEQSGAACDQNYVELESLREHEAKPLPVPTRTAA